MSATMLPPNLTIRQLADLLGWDYPRVWNLIVNEKKIAATAFRRGKTDTYRITAKEAERVKARLDQGLPL